jgi:SAM-dependent methyltransferase
MSALDRLAAEGFTRPDAYERGRPDYPPPVVAWLGHILRLHPSSVVVDLAAGTGKLTRRLRTLGTRLIAIEPSAEMRASLTAALPDVQAVPGTAESMPLDDQSVDAVTVAQAFHWFRGPEALREIARVLRPSGGLAIVFNRRDLTQPIQQELERIMAGYNRGAPVHRNERWRAALDDTRLFEPIGEQRVRNQQVLDPPALVDRVLSVSFMATLPEAERARVAERVDAVGAAHGGTVTLDYTTEVYALART